MTTQMPCLNLNGHSITPENDVAMRLFSSDASCRLATFTVLGAAQNAQDEQFGSTCVQGRNETPRVSVTQCTGCSADMALRYVYWLSRQKVAAFAAGDR